MSGKLEGLLLQMMRRLKSDVTDYCDFETVDGGFSIVGQDGSMASIARFNGFKSVLGRGQFEQKSYQLTSALAQFFKKRGHQLQVVFRRDLDASGILLANAQTQHATADRLNLAIHDLIDESADKYAQYVYEEDCYLVFWSRPSLLDPIESRMAQSATNEFRRLSNYPSASEAQNLLRPISYLADRHSAFVSKIMEMLGSPDFGASAELLDVSLALRAVRHSVYPDYTSTTWRPMLAENGYGLRWKVNDRTNDGSEFLPPSLPGQIMVASAEVGKSGTWLPDPNSIRVGNRIYAPMLVDIPPAEPQLFNALFNSLNRASTRENGVTRALPYSISIMLEGDGMSGMMMKSIMASLFAFTSSVNKNINLAIKYLQERERDGESIVKLRISLMTWSNYDPEGVKELSLRKSKLWQAMEGWGKTAVIERTGNPMEAFQSNALGLTTRSIANPCPAPLSDCIAMLPLTRPASPFSQGSTIYRSLDGKILRYQRFSSEQTTWITLISGKPGSGKSVLMNHNNVEACLLPGAGRLPYIGILDIGVSSAGFIDLIRDALPENMQHLAVYKRLQNTHADCINPLDTPLGKRVPLPKDREFLKNFLSILVTPPERRGKPYEGMSNFVGRVVDMAYQEKSDKYERGRPETYKRGHHARIDDAVAKLSRFELRPATTYWQLVDALFREGLIYEAEVAQRYAMPTLNDLVAVASGDVIKSEYGTAISDGGRLLIDTFRLGLREAVTDFPVFAGYTQFDIGPARVMSLDLQDVASIGSDAAFKQTALMYMIGRQSFMKKVAFSKEDLPQFDQLYRSYYERLINDIVDESKILCMDEFHKTGGHDGLKMQVLTDGREARKWNLEIILASQLMEDFGELTKIATTTFILDAGTEETRGWLRKNIGLSDVEENALINHVHGANADGATFLARFATKNATYTQLFTMTAGAMRLWALSTTAEDRKLRGLLYDAMPRPDARRLLARRFPGGSCKKLVERLKVEQFSGADFIDDEMSASVVERLAKDLINEYFREMDTASA